MSPQQPPKVIALPERECSARAVGTGWHFHADRLVWVPTTTGAGTWWERQLIRDRAFLPPPPSQVPGQKGWSWRVPRMQTPGSPPTEPPSTFDSNTHLEVGIESKGSPHSALVQCPPGKARPRHIWGNSRDCCVDPPRSGTVLGLGPLSRALETAPFLGRRGPMLLRRFCSQMDLE